MKERQLNPNRPYVGRAHDKEQRFQPFEQTGASPDDYVYFIGKPDGKYIRVGSSDQPGLKRILQHDNAEASGEPHRILALVRGLPAHEKKIHTYFDAWRTRPSWYRREGLINYLVWLRDFAFVATTEAEFQTEICRTVVDASVWLPGEGRESTRRTDPNLFTQMDPWGELPDRRITGDDYFTPDPILEVARSTLGAIDLDPASCVQANMLVRAKAFYTAAQKGELSPWYGRVWLNPPFSKWPIFVEKTIAELPNIEAILLLAATRTMTAKYFAELLKRVHAIGIITGRFAFWGITDSTTPPDGHFLMYYGPELERFERAMEPVGVVFRR